MRYRLATLARWLEVVTRREIVALSLVLTSVFTLLSLLTGSRGAITGWWIDWLRDATGDGVAGVPLLTGFLGLWMVLRVIEGSDRRRGGDMPILPWRVPIGLFLIFLAYLASITMVLLPLDRAARVAEGRAGGALGFFFAEFLEGNLSAWGGWGVILFFVLFGLALLGGRGLWEAVADAVAQGWEASRQRVEEGRPEGFSGLKGEEGSLPTPSGAFSQAQQGSLFATEESNAPPDRDEGASRSGPDGTATAGLSLAAPEGVEPGSAAQRPEPRWELPRLSDMLDFWDRSIDSDDLIRYRGRLLEETLALFGVPADFEGVNAGPTVTQYLIRPGYIERTVRGETKRTKVKVSKIASLTNDLALALAARTVRIEAPIPGTSYVGIEVPNSESNNVGLKELMESEAFRAVQARGRLPIALGEDVRGMPVTTDLARMPHLLIAGATGTGKSVCINSIIGCLLLTHTPETLRLLMIDPKMVELTVYNGTPHLLNPVVTEVDRAAGVLFWCIKEMERRYQLLNRAGVRDLERFNAYLRKLGEEILPYIVVIIDEMADLMMAAPEEVEKHVIRLAQMARAVGIHMIIATQRPSVDVITGLIKANFPARVAFAVTSQIDSRVVLDVPGAENLLGRGDMLFMAPDASKLERLQGAFLDDPETNRIVGYWQNFHKQEVYIQGQDGPGGLLERDGGDALPLLTPQSSPSEGKEPAEEREAPEAGSEAAGSPRIARPAADDQPGQAQEKALNGSDRDALFDEAVRVVSEAGRGSVTILQRKLRIGYNRASRLTGQLEAAGILGPDRGRSQGREVYLRAERGRDESVGKEEAPARFAPHAGRGNGEESPHANGDAGSEDGVEAEPVEAPPPADGDEDALPRVWM